MPLERAVGRMLINALVPEGLGVERIARILKRAGYSYRRTDMLSDIRESAGLFRHEGQIRGLLDNQVAPTSFMTDTKLERAFKYRVYIDVDYYDSETGQYFTGQRSFYTDRRARVGDWKRDFMEYAPSAGSDPRYKIMGMNIRGIEHNEGYEY